MSVAIPADIRHLRARVSILEEDVQNLKDKIKTLEDKNNDCIIVTAVLAEMLRRVEYDLNGEPFHYQRLGKFSISIDSEEPQQLPLNLSVTRIDNSIRIDFISGDKIDPDKEHN